jgi:hypothetical protein
MTCLNWRPLDHIPVQRGHRLRIHVLKLKIAIIVLLDCTALDRQQEVPDGDEVAQTCRDPGVALQVN